MDDNVNIIAYSQCFVKHRVTNTPKSKVYFVTATPKSSCRFVTSLLRMPFSKLDHTIDLPARAARWIYCALTRRFAVRRFVVRRPPGLTKLRIGQLMSIRSLHRWCAAQAPSGIPVSSGDKGIRSRNWRPTRQRGRRRSSCGFRSRTRTLPAAAPPVVAQVRRRDTSLERVHGLDTAVNLSIGEVLGRNLIASVCRGGYDEKRVEKLDASLEYFAFDMIARAA